MLKNKFKNELTNLKKGGGLIAKCLLLACLVFSFAGCSNKETNKEVEGSSYRRVEYKGEDYKYNSHLVNFLILGTDTNNAAESIGEADFIGLMVFDRQNKTIKFLDFSRDAYTPIKTYTEDGMFNEWTNDRLAVSYSYGDTKKEASYLTADAVGKMLNDIPLTYVASFNLDSIKNVHNLVGELEVAITDDSLEHINAAWKKGTTLKLTQENIEAFIRSRELTDAATNADRMGRQKTYLLAFYEQVKTLLNSNFEETALNLEAVLGEGFTNFDLSESEAFVRMIVEYEFNENNYYTLPGEYSSDERNHFVIDEEKLLESMVNLFYEKM